MTSQGVKFYKFSNSTSQSDSIASAKAVEGAIIYIVDLKQIWIGGATPILAVAGSTDVSFANNTLTVTTYNESTGAATTTNLNFSDVASASQTMAVFQQIYEKMGLTGANHDTIDYSSTNYLEDLGTSGHPDKNLVNADKALDAAIYANSHKLNDSTAVYDTASGQSGVISQTWIDVVEDNVIEADDTFDADIDKLDIKIAGLADELIRDEQVTQEAFTAISNSVGLESDMSLDLATGTPSTSPIHNDTSVKAALIHLDTAIGQAGKVDEVQINGTNIVSNKIANLAVDGTYNSSSNKIASQTTVTNAINALDVNTDKGAASISGSTITINAVQQEDGLIKDGGTTTINLDGTYDASTNKIATESTVTTAINALDESTDKGAASISGSTITIKAVQQEDGLIKDGGSTTINLDGTYDASTNKIATQSTVSNAIGALDTQSDVQAVAYTAASGNDGAKLTFKGVSETDGVIAQGTGTTELQFAKVATTGAAGDVSYTSTTSQMSATNVQGAIDELDTRIDALEGGFDVIKSTNAANTPAGVKWMDGQTEVTGTLTASADTFHKIYLVPAAGGSAPNSYDEYITTKTTSGEPAVTTYAWERLGTIDVDLTGYAKTVTINGKQYAVTTNTTDVNVGDVITSVTGETAISGGDADLVAVTATTTKTTADGTNATVLASSVKVEEVADGLTKDSTPSYTTGHYLIQNGKLVDASTASSGDTYTISANDGLTKASDVKAYVDSKVGTAIQSVDGSTTEKQKSVTQSDYATVKVSATTDANNNVTLDSAVGLTIQAVSTSDPSSAKGLAEASDVKSYVDGVVEGLDVAGYAQAAIDTTTTAGQTTLTVKGIQEVDGKISADSTNNVNVVMDGTYDASTNKVATKSTVDSAIGALDGSATIASVSNNVVTIKTGVTETDGIISNTTGTTDIVLEEVAVTGAASDVSYNSTTSGMTATTVQAAIDELKSGLCWEAYE